MSHLQKGAAMPPEIQSGYRVENIAGTERETLVKQKRRASIARVGYSGRRSAALSV